MKRVSGTLDETNQKAWRKMNRLQRPLITEGVYFVTSVTQGRRRWFSNPDFAQIIVDQWRHYSQAYSFSLDAFCVLPDHYHVALNSGMKKTVSQILHAVNSYSVTQISAKLGTRSKVRVWQGNPWDQVIRNQEMYWQKVAYTLRNPWHHGLVSDPFEFYPFSNIEDWIVREGEDFLIDLFRHY